MTDELRQALNHWVHCPLHRPSRCNECFTIYARDGLMNMRGDPVGDLADELLDAQNWRLENECNSPVNPTL